MHENKVPINKAPMNRAPIDRAPTNQAPINRESINRASMNKAPINRSPIDKAIKLLFSPASKCQGWFWGSDWFDEHYQMGTLRHNLSYSRSDMCARTDALNHTLIHA